MIACFMCPLGEIGMAAVGGVCGMLLMLKLCWRYVRSRCLHKNCKCNCCDHQEKPKC
jgi:hypothetical protein